MMAALQECLYSLYVIQPYGQPDITTSEKDNLSCSIKIYVDCIGFHVPKLKMYIFGCEIWKYYIMSTLFLCRIKMYVTDIT